MRRCRNESHRRVRQFRRVCSELRSRFGYAIDGFPFVTRCLAEESWARREEIDIGRLEDGVGKVGRNGNSSLRARFERGKFENEQLLRSRWAGRSLRVGARRAR